MLNNNNNSNHNNMPGNYDNLSFMSLLASGTSNTSTTTNNNTNNNNNNNNTNNNSTNNLSGSPSQQQLSSSISSSATIPSNNSSNSLYQSVPYGPHPRIPTTSTTTTAATNNTNATTSIPTPHTPQQQQQQALLMMSSAGTSLDPSSLAAHHHHHPHAHAAHFNALSHTHPVHHHHHHPALHAHAAHTHHHATAAHHHHHHHPQFSHLQTGGHQPQPRFTSSAAAIMAARYQQYQHYHLYDHGSACSCCEPIIKPPNSHMTLMTQSSSGSNLASLTASNSPQQQQQQQQAAAAAQQPLKSPNSCRQCRASHRRCDRLLPSCTQCLKRKVAVTCVYEPLKTQQSSTASSKDKDSASVANNSNSNNNNSNNNTTTTTSTATATATTTANNGGTCCDDHETGGDEKSPSTGGLQHSSSSPSLSDGNNKKMQQQKKKRSDASSNNGNGGSSNGSSSSSSNKRQKMQDDSTEEEQSTTNSSVSPSSPPSTNAALVDQQQQQQQQNMTALQRSASSSSLSGLSGSVNGGGATMPSTSPTRNNNNHFGSSSNLVSQAQQTTIFDGSQVEQYVMEHPSVATASLDVNNSGGSGGGNSGPLKLNALSSSSHQILDGCFQLVSPKEMGIHSDEFEHNLIAQFLYNKTIPNHLFHPQNENSLDQQAFLDQKASQALWFAFQAIALQQLPAMEKSPFVNTAQETRLCERVLEKLLYSMVNIKRNVSSLVQLMCKFPRTLLMQASRNMCRLAEQILLDPKIFPFIGKHMVLAQACCFLVFYLLVIGEQPEEAAVFLKAVKVYADREQRVLDIAPANVTNIISRQQLQTQQMVIQGLIDAYAAMKSALWFNSAAPKQNDFHTKKSLHKFIKLSLQAALVGSSYSSDSRLVLLKQHECLKRLKDILDNGDDTKDQLYRFLLTCQEMRRDVTNLPVESFMNTIWHIYVFNFEVFALEIAAAQLNCDFAQLQSIQVNLANEIAQEWLNCLPVVISSGARSMNLLKFISRVHIQHSVQLCSNMNVSFEDTEILMEALKFLQIDIIILDAIHNKYGVTKYKEMSDQVKIQEQIHKRFMAQTLGLQVDNVVPLPQSAASTPYNVPLPPSSSSSSALAPTTDNVEGPTSSSSSSSVGPTTTTTTTAAASSSNSIPMHENTGGLLPEQHRPMIGQPMNESLFMDLFNWQGY